MVFQSKTLLSNVRFVVYDIPDNVINTAQKMHFNHNYWLFICILKSKCYFLTATSAEEDVENIAER